MCGAPAGRGNVGPVSRAPRGIPPVGPGGRSMSKNSKRNSSLAGAIAADGRAAYIIAAEARVPPNILSGFVSGRVAPTPPKRTGSQKSWGLRLLNSSLRSTNDYPR